jgi:acyl-CoA dehydrogenase
LLRNNDNFFTLKGFSKPKIKEIKEVIEIANNFAQKVIIPRIHKYEIEIDKDPDFLPIDFMDEANRWGLFTMWIPIAFGGKGYSPTSMHFFNEVVASHCMSMANLIGVHYVGLTALSTSFNYEILLRVCAEIKKGEETDAFKTICVAATEPGAGTDLEDHNLMPRSIVGCHLKKTQQGYILNGTKVFISNGHLSEWTIVTAFTDVSKPHKAQVSLLVHKNANGFKRGKIERKLGQKACPASELVFTDVLVPDSDIIFSRDKCPKDFNFEEVAKTLLADVLNLSRTGVGSIAIGLAKASFELALDFVKTNNLNGIPMIQTEWIQVKLVKMHNNIYLSRSITIDALQANELWGPFKEMAAPIVSLLLKKIPKYIQEKKIAPYTLTKSFKETLYSKRFHSDYRSELDHNSALASMAKTISSEMANENAQIALELMGAFGLNFENKIEKISRDARLLKIYEGSNEYNQLNIFNNLYATNDSEKFVL